MSNYGTSKSITLELENTIIRDAYFNEYGQCIINVEVFFKSSLGDYSIKKTINISSEEAWGHTKEELSRIVDTLGKDKERPPKPEPLEVRLIHDSAFPKAKPPRIKPKPMHDDEPLDIDTVKVTESFFNKE